MFLLVGVVFINDQLSAQTYQKWRKLYTCWYRFPFSVTTSISNLSGESASKFPPISGVFEHAINDKFSVGGMLAYTSYKVTYRFQTYNPIAFPLVLENYTDTWKFSYIIIAARGSYHFVYKDKFDPYVGIGLGYVIGSSSFTTTYPDNAYLGLNNSYTASRVFFAAHVGCNYYLNDKMGVYGELGYGLASSMLDYMLN